MNPNDQNDPMNTDNEDLPLPSELDTLKARAERLGVSFHPSIGLEALKKKLEEKLASDAPAPEAEATVKAPITPGDIRVMHKRRALKLVRCRVTCMNPNKRDWEGEFFTGGNSVIGSVTKYVPYNTVWHVPQIIFNVIKERDCQTFITKKTPHGNQRVGKLIKEFAIEVLEDLDQKELAALAQRQAMAAGTNEDVA